MNDSIVQKEDENPKTLTQQEILNMYLNCQSHNPNQKLLSAKPNPRRLALFPGEACPQCMLVYTKTLEKLHVKMVNRDFLVRNF